MFTRLPKRFGFIADFAIVVAFASVATVFGQTRATTEERLLAGLRERQLFSLAESYCRRGLTDAYLSDRRRSELTAELARTLVEAALFAKSPEREALFTKAAETLDAAMREKPESAWRTPLMVQRGLVDLAWGERLREEAQLLAAAEPALSAARDRLRLAVSQLVKAREAVEEQLREANRRREPRPELPSPFELSSLKRHVDYQLARAYRNQGQSYPPQSADRLAALEQALRSLESLTGAEAGDDVAWQARLDEVECRRLLGDLTAAERTLDRIDSLAPPADVADRARAQRIRVRLQAAELDEAKKYVRDDDGEATSAASPDVRLAVLQWLLASAAAAESAGKASETTEYRNRAAALARVIAERSGAYWARRAEALVAAAVVASPRADDFAALTKAAESFYQQGNVDRALEIYDEAARRARAAKQDDAAFTASFTAAAVEQQRRRHAEAARRFGELAAAQPDHPRAAEADLLAAFNTAQMLPEAKTPAEGEELVRRYATLLEGHLRRYAAGKTASQARIWVGRLRRQQRDWAAATDAFAGVAPNDALALDAVRGLADCFAAQLADERRAGKPIDATLAEARRRLADYAPGYPDRLPEPSTPPLRVAATALARLDVLYDDDQFAAAASALSAILKSPDPSAEERTDAEWLLTAALVGGNRADEAQAAAMKIAAAPPDAAEIIAGAHALVARQTAEHRAAAAAVVLRLCDAARSLDARRTDDDRLRIGAAEADCLALVGRTAEARAKYDALAKRFPRDADVHEAYAEFLLTQTDRDAHAAALALWRQLERAAAENSPRWYRARLGTARSYQKLGESERALQIVELTEALHPDLGGEALKRQFERLSAELRR